MKKLLVVAVVAWLGAGTAWAQTAPPPQYLLRVTKDSVLDKVCAAYGLTVVRNVGWLYLYIVTGPVGASPDALVTKVLADKSVMTFEPDYVATTGETAGAHVKQTTEPLDEALIVDRTLSDFYGTLAWNGYAHQPAFTVLELDQARAAGNDGEGITVAVIDTGVDEENPLLKDVLLPGFDFTRNQPGASEWGDLDQSTAAILDSEKCQPYPTTTASAPGSARGQARRSSRRAHEARKDEHVQSEHRDHAHEPILFGEHREEDGTTAQSTAAILDSDCAPGLLNQSTAAILDSESETQLAGGPPLPAAFGHGTMVAGLVHAVAPRAKILPVKAFSADGTGRSSDIAQAIYYAVLSGARVLNLSFTFTSVSQEVMYATAYAALSGRIVIAAAGNEGLAVQRWPAEHQWVVGVGATTLWDTRAPFSNQGYNTFKIGAPGVNLVTTYPGGYYAAVSGTSFSAPLVSGSAALMQIAAPRLEWGATSEVVRKGKYAEISDIVRNADKTYPQRLIVPLAVALAHHLQSDKVRSIHSFR